MYVMQPSWRMGLALILMLVFIIGSSQACTSRCGRRKDCQWSSWGNQGACDVYTGYQTHTRYKTVAEKCGGSCCGTKLRRVIMCKPTATCGIRKVSPSGFRPKIFGGTDVYPRGKWPWMVTVNSYNRSCGGAIIAKKWVLTAGHCVYVRSARSTYVRAGRHDLDVSYESTQQTRFASEIVIHPDYKHVKSPFKLINDFALIKLRSDFVYNDRVQPICVATSTDGLSGCHSIGWGLTRKGSDGGGVLQEVPVTVQSSAACRDYYSWATTGRVLCVDPKENSQMCKGDSGSPLVCEKANGQYVTLGPASFGPAGCARGYTGINSAYGDVTKIVSFIRQKCANCI